MNITALASGSTGNCYHIEAGDNSALLIEAGISLDAIRRGTNFRTAMLDGVLLSHEHGDHAKSAKKLMASGIDVYASQGTLEALGLSGHRAKVLKELETVQIGRWQVRPFAVQHDCAEPFGFLVGHGTEKLVYITDSCYSRYVFRGLTRVMIEANHAADILDENVERGSLDPAVRHRVVRTHFGLDHVKSFLAANNLSAVRSIHLLHLSDGNSNEERFRREIQELTGKPVVIA